MHGRLRHNLTFLIPLCLLIIVTVMHAGDMKYYIQNEWMYMACSLILVLLNRSAVSFSLSNIVSGILILLCAAGAFLLGYRSLFFLTIVSAIILLAGSYARKDVLLPMLLVWLTSPALHSFLHGYSALIKQQLATWVYMIAGKMMAIQSAGQGILHTSAGGITINDGCMGLDMLKVNFFIAVMILFVKERKLKIQHSPRQVFFLLLISIVLNMVSNTFRIIILVWSGQVQDGLTHQAIGMICFAFYSVLPLIWISDRLRGKALVDGNHPPARSPWLRLIMLTLSLVILMAKPDTANMMLPVAQKIARQRNMCLEMISNDVIKLSDAKRIIYIKSASHNPMICWTGDGYQILPQQKTKAYTHDHVVKNAEVLNSYWWYQCGTKRTSSLLNAIITSVISAQPVQLVNVAM
ncbi:archaeosortase/exosortase family protein [Niabella sp. CJ426]|uniref:archaeosortase/exosortase family protein n=1 Tax=Niabella sp. CJ426 TaxID=3393740 RepID=UPI003D028E02